MRHLAGLLPSNPQAPMLVTSANLITLNVEVRGRPLPSRSSHQRLHDHLLDPAVSVSEGSSSCGKARAGKPNRHGGGPDSPSESPRTEREEGLRKETQPASPPGHVVASLEHEIRRRAVTVPHHCHRTSTLPYGSGRRHRAPSSLSAHRFHCPVTLGHRLRYVLGSTNRGRNSTSSVDESPISSPVQLRPLALCKSG
jgi:hypothetical protein